MKRIALLLIFTLILGTSITLVSCGNNSGNNSNCVHDWQEATTSQPKTCTLCGKTEGEPLSAYDALNDDEKEVYHALVKFSSTLDTPWSLKLIELKRGPVPPDYDWFFFVKVSGNNAFGSAVTEAYYISEDGKLITADYDLARPHDGSVGKINAALQEYFTSMGW